jgi:hypothetical protein
MEDNEARPCGMICVPRCLRTATVCLKLSGGDLHLCLTHHRHTDIGEFGERKNPPWTRERALDALINQDGLSPEEAEARVNKHFGH